MARVTKAEKIADYCAQMRAEMGIETVRLDYDKWSTVYIKDSGLYRFNDDKTTVALYDFEDIVSAECARKLGKRQYKDSMNEKLVGVSFNGALSETAVWNYINGKPIKFPRVYSHCHKLIPIEEGNYFRDFDITEDGLIEIEFSRNNHADICFGFEDIPKTGKLTVPIRFRLKEGDNPESATVEEWDEGRYIFIKTDKQEYEVRCELWGKFSHADPFIYVLESRSGSDENGPYFDLIIEFEARPYYSY